MFDPPDTTSGQPDERLIRLGRLPLSLRPLPIYSGDPPSPIECEWLAVAKVAERASSPTFILYFLDGSGRAQEVLQYETMRIALDQAHAICRFPQKAFVTCDIPVRDDGSYDPSELRNASEV